MTPHKGVTDEQLGHFHRRVRAVEKRLGKSRSYDKVMEILRCMDEDDGLIPESSVGLHAINPQDFRVCGFETDMPYNAGEKLLALNNVAVHESFKDSMLRQLSPGAMQKFDSEVWGHRDVVRETTYPVLSTELPKGHVFDEDRLKFIHQLTLILPEENWWTSHGKQAAFLEQGEANVFLARGYQDGIYLVSIWMADELWHLSASVRSLKPLCSGARIFYPITK